jgi:hypothetical protein
MDDLERKVAYADSPLDACFWASALRAAIETPEMIKAYESARGVSWLGRDAPRSGLERMVDLACGIGGAIKAQVADFVDWFNEEVWGQDPFAPGARITDLPRLTEEEMSQGFVAEGRV